MEQSRRTALKALAVGGLAAGMLPASTLFAQDTNAEEKAPVATKKKDGKALHKVVPLGFDPEKLTGLSAMLINSHHGKNYAGAVRKLNSAELELSADKQITGYALGGLKSSELAFANSIANHELYFGNLGGDGKVAGEAKAGIEDAFSSTARFDTEFRNCGKSLGGGSGWCVLSYNFHLGYLQIYRATSHSNGLITGAPILVMDMYEHAYHMDFGPNTAGYIDAFMKNVNWEVCSKRLVAAKKAAAILA
ncbi:MAG: twin-arginine translocation signal domain-containing protein [Planctomycetes bacterium]|nr:twin-arginine translocation signal domain-containing protein [Planctomycetota bacterium]